MRDARIGKHHVEPSEGRDHLVHEGLHLAGVTHVHADGNGLAALRFDLAGHGLRAVVLHVAKGHQGALGREREGRRAPDAERSSCDCRHPPLQARAHGAVALPAADQPVHRVAARAAHQDRERHADQGQVELVAVAFSRRHRHVEEESIRPVDLGHGDKHDDNETEGGRAHEKTREHGQAPEAFDERGEDGRAGRNAHGLFEVRDGPLEARPAEAAEDLLGAVGKEDDAEHNPDDEQ